MPAATSRLSLSQSTVLRTQPDCSVSTQKAAEHCIATGLAAARYLLVAHDSCAMQSLLDSPSEHDLRSSMQRRTAGCWQRHWPSSLSNTKSNILYRKDR
jgi:hypothetical protein